MDSLREITTILPTHVIWNAKENQKVLTQIIDVAQDTLILFTLTSRSHS